MVSWNGKAKWDVVYVPDADASGLDSFTYSATDCPGNTHPLNASTDTLTIHHLNSSFQFTVPYNLFTHPTSTSKHRLHTPYQHTLSIGTSRAGFAQRWSPNVGTISVNIVPVGTSSHILSTHHSVNTLCQYQYPLRQHPVTMAYQHTPSTHLIKPPHQPILSPHLIEPSNQYTLSTHPINPSYQHTLCRQCGNDKSLSLEGGCQD